MGQLVVRNHQYSNKYTSTIFMKYIFLDFTFWSYEVRSERSGSSSRMVTKVLPSSQEFLHHLYQTTKIQNMLEATNRELFIEVHVILLLLVTTGPTSPTEVGWLGGGLEFSALYSLLQSFTALPLMNCSGGK